MALTSGFFNSLDGDRRYDADQFSSFLDGIVYDGVYGAYGNRFYVLSDESEDLGIIIDTGRAWFNHTWTLNDTYYYLTMPESDLLLDRIDAVVIEVNKEDRQNSFKVVQGVPAESPSRPTLKGRTGESTEEIYQYAIAYVARPAQSTTVTQDQIVYVVDTSETPLCSALALAGVPSGGTTGQVLAKKSGESGAVGWYDIRNLPHDRPWYLVEGATEENVVAAFKFKGADTLTAALTSVNLGTEYILMKTDGVTWTQGEGLFFPTESNQQITNEALADQSNFIYSCAYGYSGMKTGLVAVGRMAIGNRRTLYLRYVWSGPNYAGPGLTRFLKDPGTSASSASTAGTSTSPLLTDKGVVAANFANDLNSLYCDGLKQSLITRTGHSTLNGLYLSDTNPMFTTLKADGFTRSSVVLTAIVFYNCELSDSQHLELAENINAMEG